MIRAEEQISQDGAPVAHHHILIQQGRLDDGVHQDLEEDRGNLDYNPTFLKLLFSYRSNKRWFILQWTLFIGTTFYQRDRPHKTVQLKAKQSSTAILDEDQRQDVVKTEAVCVNLLVVLAGQFNWL